MRGWRNWHTRRFQMPVIVKYHVGSNPIPRTKKTEKRMIMDEKIVEQKFTE